MQSTLDLDSKHQNTSDDIWLLNEILHTTIDEEFKVCIAVNNNANRVDFENWLVDNISHRNILWRLDWICTYDNSNVNHYSYMVRFRYKTMPRIIEFKLLFG